MTNLLLCVLLLKLILFGLFAERPELKTVANVDVKRDTCFVFAKGEKMTANLKKLQLSIVLHCARACPIVPIRIFLKNSG